MEKAIHNAIKFDYFKIIEEYAKSNQLTYEFMLTILEHDKFEAFKILVPTGANFDIVFKIMIQYIEKHSKYSNHHFLLKYLNYMIEIFGSKKEEILNFIRKNAIRKDENIEIYDLANFICRHGTVDQLKLLVEKGLKITEKHLYNSGYNPEPVFEYILINFDINFNVDGDIQVAEDFCAKLFARNYIKRFKLLLDYSANRGGVFTLYSIYTLLKCIENGGGIEITKYMMGLKNKYPHLEPIDLHNFDDGSFADLYCASVLPITQKRPKLLKFMFDLSVEQHRPFNIYTDGCILAAAFNSGNAEIIKYILEISIDFNSPHNPEGKCIDFNEDGMDLCRSQFVKKNAITRDNIDIAVADIAKYGFDFNEYAY